MNAELNPTRDHYISTMFLAIYLFLYTPKSNWRNERVTVIERKPSTWLYVSHPIFITVFAMVTGKLGIKSIYGCVTPIVVYCATLIFLIVLRKVKTAVKCK